MRLQARGPAGEGRVKTQGLWDKRAKLGTGPTHCWSEPLPTLPIPPAPLNFQAASQTANFLALGPKSAAQMGPLCRWPSASHPLSPFHASPSPHDSPLRDGQEATDD